MSREKALPIIIRYRDRYDAYVTQKSFDATRLSTLCHRVQDSSSVECTEPLFEH
jgi:hypothetical protein